MNLHNLGPIEKKKLIGHQIAGHKVYDLSVSTAQDDLSR